MAEEDSQRPIPSEPEKKAQTPNEKLVEDVLYDIPFATGFKNFFVREGKAVKNGWVAFFIFSGIAFWLGWSWGSSEIPSLKGDNDNLRRDNQLLSQKNGDLELTIAPLIARAAKEFPGEEINESLKKIVDELAARDPLTQPIATGSSTIDITLRSNNGTAFPNTHYMDQGAFVGFGLGSSPLLVAISHEVDSVSQPDGTGNINTVCQSPSNSAYMGKPISSLQDAKYIQLNFPQSIIPQNSQVVGGTVTWTINSSVTLKFIVPPQGVTTGFQNTSQIVISELSDGLKPLLVEHSKSTSSP
jgi:hypothetical protein